MDTAASFMSPIARELEGRQPRLTAERLARRTRQRRQLQAMIACCLLLDGLVLLTYANAGTVSVALAPAHTFCGLALVALYVLLLVLDVWLMRRFGGRDLGAAPEGPPAPAAAPEPAA